MERGAKRVAITKYTEELYACAFKNPDDSIVGVIMNDKDEDSEVFIRYDSQVMPIEVKAHSIVTIVIKK